MIGARGCTSGNGCGTARDRQGGRTPDSAPVRLVIGIAESKWAVERRSPPDRCPRTRVRVGPTGRSSASGCCQGWYDDVVNVGLREAVRAGVVLERGDHPPLRLVRRE